MDKQAVHLRAAGISASVTELLSGKNAAANVLVTHMLTDPIQSRVVRDAFSTSLQSLWIIYACFSFCGIVTSVIITSAVLSKKHNETVTGLKDNKTNAPGHTGNDEVF